MKDLFELRMAGSGGQGVILASIILAEAALKESMHVAQSQSYGPEARGGTCKSDVVISNDEIDYPKVEDAGCLVAFTQESLDQYAHIVCDGGVIITDSKLNYKQYEKGKKVIPLAILKTASETLGKPVTANIVALGALNAVMNIVSDGSLEAAVLKYAPKGTEELNLRALREGKALVL